MHVRQSLAIFIALFLLSTAFITAGWVMSSRLVAEHNRRRHQAWLLSWSIKGMVIPFALWVLVNIGLSWQLQPFMPAIQAARNAGGDWFSEFLRVVAIGLFIISSYWTALTLGWTLGRAGVGLSGDARSDFRSLCLTCFLAIIAPAIGIVVIGGWPLLGLAATAMLGP